VLICFLAVPIFPLCDDDDQPKQKRRWNSSHQAPQKDTINHYIQLVFKA
jgi:hypothetical protein